MFKTTNKLPTFILKRNAFLWLLMYNYSKYKLPLIFLARSSLSVIEEIICGWKENSLIEEGIENQSDPRGELKVASRNINSCNWNAFVAPEIIVKGDRQRCGERHLHCRCGRGRGRVEGADNWVCSRDFTPSKHPDTNWRWDVMLRLFYLILQSVLTPPTLGQSAVKS